ncbi:MAG: hypothetical protein AB8H47_31165 [Bacteroidia bacterium]
MKPCLRSLGSLAMRLRLALSSATAQGLLRVSALMMASSISLSACSVVPMKSAKELASSTQKSVLIISLSWVAF